MPPPYHHHSGSASTNPYSNRPSNFPATATPSTHMNMHGHGGTNPAMYSSTGLGVGSGGGSGSGSSSMSATKTRQYAQLHASLAQLNAHLSDTQNLVRMTAVQAEDMRFLGGYVGALFMGSAKVLGEEGVKGSGAGVRDGQVKREEEEVVVKREG